jgi:long-subunit acyl-CoA synthetase (AMP-forming)/GNAT superfamily N-acetyltransferase
MTETAPAEPLASLGRHWTHDPAPGETLLTATREAFLTVRPGDIARIAPLVQSLLERVGDPSARDPVRRALFTLLDTVRRRAFMEATRPEQVDPWLRVLLPVIQGADYTFGDLLRSREETDPKTVAIRTLGADTSSLTVAEVARRTRSIARGLYALMGDEPDPKVAILSENSLEAALADLACLSNGILDFPLPANAVAEQVVYMLKHSGARVLLVSDDEQVAKVLPGLSDLPELKAIVSFSRSTAERHGLLSLDQMVGQGGGAFDDALRAERAAAVRSRDVATVMYTSGTTGRPKGIIFTHENVVSKRLCRAFALPRVGEGDVFLAYLPLYHTFGRWLELTGSLWWGGTYVFARSTAQASLLEDFKAVRPSIFISVPKKWIELHDAAALESGGDDPAEVAVHLRAITGGKLRYGLSAAGYLDPLVFKTFHRAGIELCSGYGMTEATGGILMTSPGAYVEGSIGRPLPGVDCRRADDGELLIRGVYVSPGYYGGEQVGETGLDAEGWFHTGDLVSVDAEGHYRITGRKKEIYKNRAGQTIAPQRVENLFRDFDAVAQAFLVGDHREYNTLLVWPNYEKQPQLRERTPEELRDLLSSLVASANRFLAPFERVVAFQVLPRALDEEHGELTHKQSFKREAVEANWRALIEPMYERKHLSLAVEGGTLRVPNWVLRELSVLQHEVVVKGDLLVAGDRTLRVGATPEAPGAFRIGDLAYAAEGTTIDLGQVLGRPSLWLGNEALRRFIGDDAFSSLASRRRRPGPELRLDPRLWEPPADARLKALLELVDREQVTFHSIHAAGELLRAERPEARRAVAHLQLGLAGGRPEYAALARALLRRAADAPDDEIRRRAFRVLLPAEEPATILSALRHFLDRLGPLALRDEDLLALGERGLSDAQIQALLDSLAGPATVEPPRDASDRRLLVGTMRLLTACAVAHPGWFARVRVPLSRVAMADDEELAARAAEEVDRLRRGFSNWIGPNLRRAIDPETGEEYGWKDVVTFEPDIDASTRSILLNAIGDVTLVRASVFLLSHGALVSLADIPPGGASVSTISRRRGRSVYRLTLHTRARETHEIAVNLNDEMHPAELREDINWLLAAGAPPPLVEAFAGYFPEYGIFTEEFIPGETVAQLVERLEKADEVRRLKPLWPFVCWASLAAHVDFWDRTGRRLALHEPTPSAFIVPPHDNQAGARLVSITDRTPCTTFDKLLDRFVLSFMGPLETANPSLRGVVEDDVVFSAVIEALGLDRGLALLEVAAAGKRGEAIAPWLERVKAGGFTPRLVYFAIRRFARWAETNLNASEEGIGKMLGELWRSYRLDEVEQQWSDTRIRFFRSTVFAKARPELGEALDRLMARARALPPGALDLEEQVASIRGSTRATPEEDYFLARMTYRHLRPQDEAALISMPSGDRYVTEVVVTVTDDEGGRYSIRGPTHPREVARFFQLCQDAHLSVTFGGEHEYLLAIDEREHVIGGLFYRWLKPPRAYFEKLVVGRKHRGRGIGDSLMREFFRRMRGRGVTTLETGYFAPELLRRYGFRTDPASGGVVRDLEQEDPFRW